jgi:prepilin-type N-terminal cleavage/methylation domain-containing protein
MRTQGFTLLEVLVAVTILGLGFATVFAGISGSLRSIERVRTMDQHVELARQKLAELDLLQRIRPADSASGQFPDGTHWTLQSSPFIEPVTEGELKNAASIIRIDLTIEWMGRSGPQKQTIQSYRYQVVENLPIPSLEQQLHELQ